MLSAIHASKWPGGRSIGEFVYLDLPGIGQPDAPSQYGPFARISGRIRPTDLNSSHPPNSNQHWHDLMLMPPCCCFSIFASSAKWLRQSTFFLPKGIMEIKPANHKHRIILSKLWQNCHDQRSNKVLQKGENFGEGHTSLTTRHTGATQTHQAGGRAPGCGVLRCCHVPGRGLHGMSRCFLYEKQGLHLQTPPICNCSWCSWASEFKSNVNITKLYWFLLVLHLGCRHVPASFLKSFSVSKPNFVNSCPFQLKVLQKFRLFLSRVSFSTLSKHGQMAVAQTVKKKNTTRIAGEAILQISIKVFLKN